MSSFLNQKILFGIRSAVLLTFAWAGICFGQTKWEFENPIYGVKSISSVTYGNNQFVAVGKAYIPDDYYGTKEFTSILTSTDGEIWTTKSLGITEKLNSVVYVNNQFVTVGNSGRILTSPDGKTWTIKSSGTTNSLGSVTFGNGQFVVVGFNGTILTSPDGTTWTTQNSGTTILLHSVTYSNGRFVAVGYYSTILTSSDGTTWTTQNSGLILTQDYYHYLTSVTYGNGKYVAVGGISDRSPGVTGPIHLVLTSIDGSTWTKIDVSGTNSYLESVTFGNNQFVAVGSEGEIRTSPDGMTWTPQNSGTTNSLGSVTYGNDMFMAVGSSAIILTSKNKATDNCKATDIGKGTIVFEVTLPTSQQHVEIFVRQNGIQNVAQNITNNVEHNNDNTNTYKFINSGYKAGDVVEYRFYSSTQNGPSVFTPGPIENSWNKITVAQSNFIAPVTKDATLILSSYCCGFVPGRNFGSNSTVDAGTYHHTCKGAFGFSLSGIPSEKVVTEAFLVFPHLSSAGGGNGSVGINKINNSASWQESTVTWNNSPAYTFYNTFKLPYEGLASVNITDLVSGAVLAGEKEISIMMTPDNSNNFFVDSKENPSGKAAYIYIKTR